jgi:hypothetical protein
MMRLSNRGSANHVHITSYWKVRQTQKYIDRPLMIWVQTNTLPYRLYSSAAFARPMQEYAKPHIATGIVRLNADCVLRRSNRLIVHARNQIGVPKREICSSE